MIKKSLFKKITALALATCLATSPAVIYAADDAEAVFVEQETVTTDEASSDEGYAEEVFTEDVNEEEKIEETVTEEPEFVGDDVAVEENNEPVFVQEDSVVTEDSATEEVAAAEEAFGGVDAETMALLTAGNDVVDENVATDDAAYADVTITFNKNDGSGNTTTQSVPGGTATPLSANTFTREGTVFVNWNTDSNGQGTSYSDGASITVSQDTTLYAQWATVAKIGTTEYKTLALAFAASGNNTIVLQKDIELGSHVEVAAGKSTTLNLNGYSIKNKETSTLGDLINVVGSFTVTGSGSMTNTKGSAISSTGTLNIGATSGTNSFTLTGKDNAVAVTAGTVTVNAGTLVATEDEGKALSVTKVTGTPTATVKGGTFTGTYGLGLDGDTKKGQVSVASTVASNLVIYPDNKTYVDVPSGTSGYVTLWPLGDALGVQGAKASLFREVELATPGVTVTKTGLTLDLNGNSISNGSNTTSSLLTLGDNTNPAGLTIVNSGTSGGITNTYSEGSAITINDTTANTLTLGTKSKSNSFTVSGSYPAIKGGAASTIEVNCGTITSSKAAAISGAKKVTINAGTITGATDGIKMDGGTGSELLIKGGTITPGSGSAIAYGKSSAELLGTVTIESAATINGTKPLTLTGNALGAATVKVYNDTVVQNSVVDITTGCFWVKGSIADHYELKAANTSFTEDDLVIVANDYTTDSTISVNKTIDFDLNGHTITSSAKGIEVTAGTLTVYNSNTTTEGKITAGAATNGIEVSGSGSLVVGKSGKTKFTIGALNAIKILSTTGTVKIEGGTITGGSTGVHIEGEKATLTVNGGTITGTSSGDVYVVNGTVTLNKAATYNGTKNLKVTNFKEVKVYDKAVDTTKAAAVDVGDNMWSDKGTYETLVSKADLFKTDGTVKLNANLEAPILVSAKITLDLNGHNVVDEVDPKERYAIGIEKGGDLTIINSSTTDATIGHGTATSPQKASSIEMLSSGTKSGAPKLTVGSASDTTQNNFTINGADYGIYDAVDCTTTVNGGEIKGATAIEHDAGSLTVIDGNIGTTTGTTSTYGVQFGGSTAASATLKGGTYVGSTNAVKEDNTKLSPLKISGGLYNGGDAAVAVTNAEGFMTGGVYSSKPSKDHVANGYGVEKNTDSGAATYPWKVYSSSAHATLTLSYTPTAASTAPSSDPTDLEDLEEGTVVALTAKPATTGYTFDGWYRGTTRLVTTATYNYTTTAADTTLTAVYTKDLTVTIKNDEVVSGTAYAPKNTVDSLTVTGLDSSDTAATVLDVSAMKLTSTYNKDTSAIGTTYPITQTGLKIKTSTSTLPKYNLKTTTNGTLTVIAGTGPEEFIAEVNKLPAATAVTVDNLAATKTAVEKAKADYAKLSTASKNLDTVKAAKTKLDAVDAAVTKLDTDKKAADAADKLIQALPAAKDATSADREKLDAATKAFNALTADQKKLVPTADQTKLADVTKAVEAAEKADQEAAAAVKKLIDALPTVAEATADDREALDAAQKAYDALTPAQKKLLPGAQATLDALDDVITAAEEKQAADKKAADAVTAKINALPDPEDATKDDRAAVNEAKDALAALTPAQQKLVPQTAKDRLEAVDEAVKAKEDDTDQKAADACMEKIEAIKKQPAGKGKAATEEARAAYDALTDAQKALLPKSAESLLTAAEEAYTKDRTFQCGDNWYKVLPSGNVSYNRPADSDCTSATVPNQIKQNGYMYKVVKVSIGAFKNCTSLEWVVINKNIQIIGEYAFKNTPSLTKIKVLTRQLKAGKVVKAFAAGGKSNGAKLTVKTPSTYVAPYDSLFKGEGLLNQKATVKAA